MPCQAGPFGGNNFVRRDFPFGAKGLAGFELAAAPLSPGDATRHIDRSVETGAENDTSTDVEALAQQRTLAPQTHRKQTNTG
ncbi:hypothetical protein [Paludibacterium purpuratum]|uniref:hypothetical protein n=1 Tax=Paludibacterium purpuratum TaxID=1144873 RepID=UPI0010610F82|nr:hypothetical protein [Paludibacterium purpuratum]